MATSKEKSPAEPQALEKTPAAQAIEQAPAYIKTSSAGLEEASGREDFVIPRITIAQSTTPQRKKQDPHYIPGLEEGQLFNTVTGKIYGTSLRVIMLFFFKQQMLFTDIDKGGGLLCISANGVDGGQLHPQGCASCEKNQFKEGNPPECTALKNYAILVEDEEVGWEAAVTSMKSTQINKARDFNSKVRLTKKPMYARFVLLETIPETKHNQSYFGIKLTPQGWVPEEMYRQAEQYFTDLKAKGIKVDTTGISEEERDEFSTEKF